MGFSRQEYWKGCHALLQEVFLTQRLNPLLLCLPHWQVGSLPLVPTGKPPCLLTPTPLPTPCLAYISLNSKASFGQSISCFQCFYYWSNTVMGNFVHSDFAAIVGNFRLLLLNKAAEVDVQVKGKWLSGLCVTETFGFQHVCSFSCAWVCLFHYNLDSNYIVLLPCML